MPWWQQYLLDSILACVGSLLVTAGIAFRHLYPRIPNISIVYLLVIVGLASTRGRYSAILASVIAFFSFDFFIVPPLYTFVMYHIEEWIALFVFLVDALITSQLAVALRKRAEQATRREHETRILYDLTRLTTHENTLEQQLHTITQAVVDVFSSWGIREHSNVPIIVLSVKGAERDKVEALDLGADDYIQKPFGINEVLARILVALRHVASAQTGTEPQIQIGPLLVDFAQRLVQLNERSISLTPTEYDLLKVLLTQRGKILTRQMLLQAVWGAKAVHNVHTLHVHVAHLRQKIEPDPLHPSFILTVPGVGYRFREDEPEKDRGEKT
jgi:two-component system KDP operon response regulator KdpE